jgi:hypothetical protein
MLGPLTVRCPGSWRLCLFEEPPLRFLAVAVRKDKVELKWTTVV